MVVKGISKQKRGSLLKQFFFGKTEDERYQAITMLARDRKSDSGWLLETIAKEEKRFRETTNNRDL